MNSDNDLPSFLINAVGPDLSIPGQSDVGQGKANDQGQQQNIHPALFATNQIKGDLNPGYAAPFLPSRYYEGQGIGGHQGITSPSLVEQPHLKKAFGSVYAPAHHRHGQGAGEENRQQWYRGGYRGIIPYCYPCYMYPSIRR